MRHPQKALGYEVVGELAVFNVFAKAKGREREQVMRDTDELGQQLADSLM